MLREVGNEHSLVSEVPFTLVGRLVHIATSYDLTGVLSDATKSVSRAYINNFQDKGKQTAIDIFLVRLLPLFAQKYYNILILWFHL